MAERSPAVTRAAVIGVGYLGRFHAQKYAEIPDAELVSFATGGHFLIGVQRSFIREAIAGHILRTSP